MKVQERRRRDRGPKGRPLDDSALAEVRALLGDRPRRRDLLIEFLHLIQDEFRCLSARHLRALAEEMRHGAGGSLRGRLVLRSFRRGEGRRAATGAAHDQGVRFDQLHAGRRGDAPGGAGRQRRSRRHPRRARALRRPLRRRAGRPSRQPRSRQGHEREPVGDGARRRHQGRSAGLHRARRLSRGGRLPASAKGARRRDRGRSADRHAAGCGLARPGRRRLSQRQEVGDRPHLSRPAPDVDQWRRRRARHLQGPRLSRARSAPQPSKAR